jgi:hypothetical protein
VRVANSICEFSNLKFILPPPEFASIVQFFQKGAHQELLITMPKLKFENFYLNDKKFNFSCFGPFVIKTKSSFSFNSNSASFHLSSRHLHIAIAEILEPAWPLLENFLMVFVFEEKIIRS